MRPPPKSIRSPAPSLTQYSAPTASGCSRQSQERPKSSPTSSSAVAAKIRSPRGSKPSRASEAIATAFAATCPFMSSAPRPQTSPLRSSPENGCTCHASGDACHEVRPLRHLRVELTPHAEGLEVVAQQLGRTGLVPRRIRGVDADQPLQELGHLVAEGERSHQRLLPRISRYSRSSRTLPSGITYASAIR